VTQQLGGQLTRVAWSNSQDSRLIVELKNVPENVGVFFVAANIVVVNRRSLVELKQAGCSLDVYAEAGRITSFINLRSLGEFKNWKVSPLSSPRALWTTTFPLFYSFDQLPLNNR
jgi:hypothetical protein